MKRKIYAWFYRSVANVIPCIRGTGGRVVFLSEDFMHLTVRLRLNLRTRNVVGTIFGGSMYASTDPFFMLMLMQILGKNYVVWDKGCTIRFKRPAKQDIFADFIITPEMLSEVKAHLEAKQEHSFTWRVDYKDKAGVVYAEFDKILYVAKKDFYQAKLRQRQVRA